MRRKALILGAVALVVGSFTAWWFLGGPRRVAEGWAACPKADPREFLTEREYVAYVELEKQRRPSEVDAWEKACLRQSTITVVDRRMLRAVAKTSNTMPKLTWDEMSKFPAGSNEAEKLSILKERAGKAKTETHAGELNLTFAGGRWTIDTDFQEELFYSRGADAAGELRKAGDYGAAIEAYEALAAAQELANFAEWRKHALDERLAVLGERACVRVAKRQMKFPAAAEFVKLRSFATSGGTDPNQKRAQVSVYGDVLVPNGFGVKSSYSISCTATEPVAKGEGTSADELATVDLRLTPEGFGERPISAEGELSIW